jgi:uncharacterized protein (DUF1800 family)
MKSQGKYWILGVFLWVGLINPAYPAASTDPKILHLLNRLSFGPRPGDVAKVQKMGAENYIQEQLSPASIKESPSLIAKIASFETLQKSPVELLREYNFRRPRNQKPTPEEIKAARERSRLILQEALKARLLRATESSQQLQEVMVDFWYNHFNVFANKGLDRILVGSYEEQAIRPYVLGNFRQLLGATAHHPAMLFYLDNWQNTAPNSSGSRGRFKGLNENYARELMELHTLGVDGGYTQQDVIALARILTGWGMPRPNTPTSDNSGFYFDSNRHDFGEKVFLGQTIKGSGVDEGEKALDILVRSPATAHHISYKLAEYFVADQPPKALVDRLAKRFQATDGDIKAVLTDLFASPEFNDPKYYNAKFKTPYQYVISSLRATGTEVNNFNPITGLLIQMGMPLYGCQTPNGYSNTQETWLNPDAMTRRLSFATAIASGRLNLQQMPNEKSSNNRNLATPLNATALATTLGDRFSEQTQKAIASSPIPLRAALILGSPEFMHR